MKSVTGRAGWVILYLETYIRTVIRTPTEAGLVKLPLLLTTFITNSDQIFPDYKCLSLTEFYGVSFVMNLSLGTL